MTCLNEINEVKLGNGTLVNGNNIVAMKKYPDTYFDNCISDFPYNLAFMGKEWDNQINFYDWCFKRAIELHRIIKHGGYALIFGHHKTNYRMKCAFEDAGFNIVEEIDWIYGSGFPKNQDISRIFDKKGNEELSKEFEGWKTSGLKPAKEIITIFQKPLDGTYINNISKHGCGAMNIESCRVEYKNENDLNLVKANVTLQRILNQ